MSYNIHESQKTFCILQRGRGYRPTEAFEAMCDYALRDGFHMEAVRKRPIKAVLRPADECEEDFINRLLKQCTLTTPVYYLMVREGYLFFGLYIAPT